MLRLSLLGPPRVETDGAVVRFDTRKAIALLALVAMSEQPLSRDRLAAMLWPESDEDKGRAALRRTVSVTATGVGAALLVTRATIGLRAGMAEVDSVEFRRLLAGGDVDSLDRACALYRDDFLAGFGVRDSPDFDDWQSATAHDLRQRLSKGLDLLVAASTARGELEKAVETATRWVSLDVLHEPAQRALIRLLAMTGRRSAALRQYRECVRALADELGVAPLRETTALYEDVRSGQLSGSTPAVEKLAPPVVGEAPSPAATEAPAPVVADIFVGREQQLQALGSTLAAPGRLALLVGETGSGKTRLIAQFCSVSNASVSEALVVRAHQGEASLPFAVLSDLLAQALRRRPDLTTVLPDHVVLEVSRLVPAFSTASRPVAEALTGPVGLARFYGAVAATLVAATAPDRSDNDAEKGSPLLLVVEDVHWADDATLSVLTYLINRLAELPLVMLLSWAPEAAGRLSALRNSVTDAVDEQRAAVVPVPPLTAADIEALLAASGSTQFGASSLLAETRGLARLVVEYVRAGQAGPVDAPPATVRELLVRRLDDIAETTGQLLSAAAVLNSHFDTDLIRQVSGRSDDETADALEDAILHRLLEEIHPTPGEPGQVYDFPFDALRTVVSERTTFARSRLLHGRAAETLARRHERQQDIESSAAVVAHHFERAGRDAEAAQWWWRAAMRSRALFAHEQAHADLSRALALGYPPAEVWAATGDALVALGRYVAAISAYETAAGLAVDTELVASLEHRLAEVHHRLGDWTAADSHLRAAVELLDAEASTSAALAARIGSDRAMLAYRQGDVAAARSLAEAALSTSEVAGDATAAAQALDVLGMVAAAAGDLPAAEELLHRSVDRAQTVPNSGVAAAALNNLARLLVESGRRTEALETAREALRLGAERADQHRLAALHTNLADLLHASGDESEALDHLKEAARLFAAVDTGGEPRAEVWTLVEW
jgi:DNA-binding SARP family transcriptional activator/tetratricopeptide (TPR) repeat protein